MSRKPILYSKIVRSSETPKIVSFLIENKVVRTETQAVFFLIFVAAVSSVLAFYIFVSISGGVTSRTFFTEVYPTFKL
jgi:hypothetical protein